MTGECRHCWHPSNTDENKPMCCWCGTSLVFTFAIDHPPERAHGPYASTPTVSIGPQVALATLERVRDTLRDHHLNDAEDDVLEVMDQITGWCSLHIRL